MKKITILLILILSFSNLTSAQTLIQEDITIGNQFTKRMFLPNGIYFSSFDQSNSSFSFSLLDASENITHFPSLTNFIISGELNGLIYMLSWDEEKIATINTSNQLVQFIFTAPPNDWVFLSNLAELNGELYIVSYDIPSMVYDLHRLDLNGSLIGSYAFPNQVGVTNIHANNNLIYCSTDTPSDQYFKFDPALGTMVAISSSEYNSSLGSPVPDCSIGAPIPSYFSMEVAGETYSINSNGQLTSDLNPIDLTCFDIAFTGEGPIFPNLLGYIGNNLYLTYNGGSINGIYRYPEMANEGLCEDPICDQSIKRDVHVEDGDVYLEASCRGVVFTTPAGDCYRMTVDNYGDLETTFVTCPN
jgi:hypothetical protein